MTRETPKVHIREDVGLWQIAVTDNGHTWARHAWTRDRAEQIARDLVTLAYSFRKDTDQ